MTTSINSPTVDQDYCEAVATIVGVLAGAGCNPHLTRMLGARLTPHERRVVNDAVRRTADEIMQHAADLEAFTADKETAE